MDQAASDVKTEMREFTIKGRCQECQYYQDCPKMRGESECQGKREIVVLRVNRRGHDFATTQSK
jgi:hypothetical protein